MDDLYGLSGLSLLLVLALLRGLFSMFSCFPPQKPAEADVVSSIKYYKLIIAFNCHCGFMSFIKVDGTSI